MTHQEFRELLPLYVIGALDGDELVEFERYLAERRAECEAELRAYQATADKLALLPVAADPSPAVFHRLMAEIEEPEGPFGRRASVPDKEAGEVTWRVAVMRWIPWTMAVLLCVFLFVRTGQLGMVKNELSAKTGQNELLRQENEELKHRLGQHQAHIADMTRHIEGLNNRLEVSAADRIRLAQQLQLAGQANQELSLQVGSLKSQVLSLEEQIRQAKLENDKLARARDDTQREADQLRKTLEQQSAQVAAMEREAKQNTALLDILKDAENRIVNLKDLRAQSQATGRLLWNDRQKSGVVFFSGLPAVMKGEGQDLVVWLVCAAQAPVAAGIGWTDADGRGEMEIHVPREIQCAERFVLTIEPTGRSRIPTGTIILAGE